MTITIVATDTVQLTKGQQLVQQSIREICENFGPDYCREKDRE